MVDTWRLAKGVIESVVDQCRRDAHARGGVAIIDQRGLQAVVLLIAVDVGEPGSLLICWSSTGPQLTRSSRLSL